MYNKGMGGVDLMDQKTVYVTWIQMQILSPNCFYLMYVALVNNHIVYQHLMETLIYLILKE